MPADIADTTTAGTGDILGLVMTSLGYIFTIATNAGGARLS
ncbi:hypothetical protein GCM10023094_40130 [Rhodococcus olei]|uniref:Uncharacterized protein n=1 Tax=Rhodococcus olei TaxID=2161675 RepID=A0ABP8PFN6_9NOCA